MPEAMVGFAYIILLGDPQREWVKVEAKEAWPPPLFKSEREMRGCWSQYGAWPRGLQAKLQSSRGGNTRHLYN